MSDDSTPQEPPLDLRQFVRELNIGPLNYAMRRIIRMGLPFPEPPVTDTQVPFPADLSACTPEELSQQLGQWSAFCSYTWALHGEAIVARDHAHAEAQRIYDEQIANAANIGVTKVATQKSRAASDEKVQKARQHLARAEALVEMLSKFAAGYDRYYQAVSRQITVLEAELRRRTAGV